MVLVVADRVQETTSTTGTSDYTLLGASQGFQSFGSVMANSDTTYYAVTNGTDWEVGIGTYSTTGPTMARTTILSSSNAGAAVSWGTGTKDIFLSYAASKSVYLDASGNLSVDGTTLFVDATNDRVGIGTNTPAVKEEILGNTPVAAQFISNVVSGTTLDVTSLISGALAVGQYLGTQNGRVRIIALGTGTGGVGTYILDTDQTGNAFSRSYADAPTTMRLGNSATVWDRNIPYGTIEFGGAITNTGPRGYIQTQASAGGAGTAIGSMLFGVGQTNGAAPPRTAMLLTPSATSLAGNLTLGNASLSPRNLTISPATLGFQGRSQTIYTAGNLLSYMTFNANYINASVETAVQYGVVGYNVDSSITSGQLPSNFFIQTRNASGTIAERFRIDKDGNVGIGTTAPSAKLDVNGAVAVQGGMNVYGAYFNVGGAADLTVDATAHRVGINTALPTEALEVTGSAYINGNAYFASSGSDKVGIGTLTPAANTKLDVAGILRATGIDTGVRLLTSSATTFAMDVTTPATIVVSGTSAQTITLPDVTTIRLSQSYTIVNNNTSGAITVGPFGGGTFSSTIQPGMSARLICVNGGVNALTSWVMLLDGALTSTGTLNLVFSSSPTISNPSITGDLTIADKIIHSGDTDTAIRFPVADTVTVETAGTERMRIDASGNVGIGTTAAADYKLDVDGGFTVGGTYNTATSTNGGGVNVGFDTTNGGKIESLNPGVSWYPLTIGGTDLVFTASGVERLRIASTGAIGLSGANYGTSGQVITSNGSGSAPSWQNLSSAQVGAATAGLASGAVGSYIWAACSGLISPGDTRAGSNLSPAGLFTSANWPQGAPAASGTTVNGADTGAAPYGGTWRCMGSSLNYTAYPARARLTLFLRIS
jgi:hypothetical protein